MTSAAPALVRRPGYGYTRLTPAGALVLGLILSVLRRAADVGVPPGSQRTSVGLRRAVGGALGLPAWSHFLMTLGPRGAASRPTCSLGIEGLGVRRAALTAFVLLIGIANGAKPSADAEPHPRRRCRLVRWCDLGTALARLSEPAFSERFVDLGTPSPLISCAHFFVGLASVFRHAKGSLCPAVNASTFVMYPSSPNGLRSQRMSRTGTAGRA